MAIQKVYKTVRRVGNKLTSRWRPLPLAWIVEYKLGRWVTSNDGISYLWACTTISNARGYMDSGCEIYLALADVVKRDGRAEAIKDGLGASFEGYCGYAAAGATAARQLRSFWRWFRKITKRTRTKTHYSGGVYCRKIKLIKKVK